MDKKMINKIQLKEIINDLSEVCNELSIRVSDEVLLREASTYQRDILANENRSSHGEKRSDFSPSIKQFKILSGMGLSKEKINQMSKLEVSKLIGEYLNSLKKENI
jgi:hypothetical protein